jgi:adenosine deaminase
LARQLGLPITLHCGEVVTPGEAAAMLTFAPDRLGHCVHTVRAGSHTFLFHF